MSDVEPSVPLNSLQWWLSSQGTSTGPFSEAYVLAALNTGAISPQTYACPVGDPTWRRLCEWPAFAAACAMCPPPPPPAEREVPPSAPWNPRTIAWLGLLFSPVWAGIMAAINTRRLHRDLPLWRPLAIGIGATVLDLFVPSPGFYGVDLALYLGAVWLIWHLDLRRQVPLFEAQKSPAGRHQGWLWPSLAGSPLALLVLFGFLVVPFLPLEPRGVCQRFVEAGSVNEARAYTTTKLWPAMEAMFAQKDGPDFQGRFDLTDEAEAPPEIGGYLVGYRLYGEPKGEAAFLVEGFFHLKQQAGTWKIEDWYLTSRNNQPTAEPVSVAANYRTIFPRVPPREPQVTSPSSDMPIAATAQRGWLLSRWFSGSSGEKVASREAGALAAEGRALAGGEHAIAQEGKGFAQTLKRLGAMALAALAALAAWGKSLLRGSTSPEASGASSSPFAPGPSAEKLPDKSSS